MTAPDQLDEEFSRFTATVEAVQTVLFIISCIAVAFVLAWLL